MTLKKILATLTIVVFLVGAAPTATLAAPPDLRLWDRPIITRAQAFEFEVLSEGSRSKVFIGPGPRRTSDVALTITDHRIYAGPITRLDTVLFTVEGNRMWPGPNTHGLQNAVFTLSEDNRIYAGPSTWGLQNALYTIRENHVYEGPVPRFEAIILTADADLEHTDAMTKLVLPILIEGRF